jgi:addiction module HigA family antidote
MIKIPTDRPPTPPGEFVQELLDDFRVSQSELARRIGVPFQRVNDVVHARRAVTASTALRLARFFGNSAQFWMNAQLACDLYETAQRERDELERIEPVGTPRRE